MRNRKALCVIITIATAIAAAITGAVFFMKRHRRKGYYAACVLIATVAILGTSITAYAKPPGAEETGYICECETDCTETETEAEPTQSQRRHQTRRH